MTNTTHALAGLVAAEVLIRTGHPPEAVAVQALGMAVLGALLPDIDHPYSYVGRRVSLVPYLLGGHRRAAHSLLAALAVVLLARRFLGLTDFLLLALGGGYISHLALDLLNPEGVMLLWPLPFWIRLPLPWPLAFSTGSVEETFVLRPLLAGAAILLGGRLWTINL